MSEIDLPERDDEFDFDKEYPLPYPGMRLFISSGNPDDLLQVDPLGGTDPEGNRSSTGRWSLYEDGYKHAADILVEKAKEEFLKDALSQSF